MRVLTPPPRRAPVQGESACLHARRGLRDAPRLRRRGGRACARRKAVGGSDTLVSGPACVVRLFRRDSDALAYDLSEVVLIHLFMTMTKKSNVFWK